MADPQDRNYISIGSWVLQFFVMAIPFVNFIMIFVWAFSGDNESRKNYYKAVLILSVIWIVIVILLSIVALSLGLLPVVIQAIREGQAPTM